MLRLLALLFMLGSFAGCVVDPNSCDSTSCTGCCDANGVCQSPSPLSCGVSGQICQTCLLQQSCVFGQCVDPVAPRSDAGSDAGSSSDAGSTVDAGGIDAGSQTDAGSTFDAGAMVDAGTTVDAGTRIDAGVVDAGPQGSITLKVIAFNDFHGNIATDGRVNVARLSDGGVVTERAGAAAYFARAVADLRAQTTHSILVSAGDLIGASPLVSKGLTDEPTLMVMNEIGLDIAAVGNHEFDEGIDELLRLQSGQCRPEGCFDAGRPFTTPRFRFLGANVERTDGGRPLDRYEIRTFDGVKVGFIGMTLENTASALAPKGSAGLRFTWEVQTVNQLIPELRAQGVRAVVVVLHQGGSQRTNTPLYNNCDGLSGSIVNIVNSLDPAVDLVVSGHSHQAYNCECFSDGGCSKPVDSTIRGRRVTSALAFGQLVTDIDLEIDRGTGEVISIRQDNRVVTRNAVVPAVEDLVQSYLDDTAGMRLRQVGRITQAIGTNTNLGGSSPLGSLVADSQVHGTRAQNSVLAFMNAGGIRASLPYSTGGIVTYEDIFNVTPFGNSLVTLTLTGNQVFALLEQQLQGSAPFLQVSRGFTYNWSSTAPSGSKVIRSSVMLHGAPINPTGTYRVVVSDFLAGGGDGLSVFTQGTQPVVGPVDLVALEAYFADAGVLSPPPSRIFVDP